MLSLFCPLLLLVVVLRHVIGDGMAKQAMAGLLLINAELVRKVDMALYDIDPGLVRSFFTDDGFVKFSGLLDSLQDAEFQCSTCDEALTDVRSVSCDACLQWFHFHCVGISRPPRTKVFFCPPCRKR